VAVGCIFEIGETWTDLRRWIRLKKGLEVSEENPTSWIVPIGAIGLLLVILGVVGEGVFEGLVSKTDTALRAHDEQILGDTESKFGQVKDSAEAAARAADQAKSSASTADVSAKEASSRSGEAVTSAGTAIALAKDARQEADSFEKDIASANKTAIEAEKHLAEALREAAQAEAELKIIKSPRSLVNVPALVAALKPYKGTEYTLEVFGDSDALQLTKEIGDALESAGWNRKQPKQFNIGVTPFSVFGPNELVLACVETGVQVHIRSPRTLEALQNIPSKDEPKTAIPGAALRALLSMNMSPADERNVGDKLWVDMATSEAEPIRICVGKKP